MLPVFFRRPFKMMFAERANSPVTLGEFLCASLLLAGVVAALWLAAGRPGPSGKLHHQMKLLELFSGTGSIGRAFEGLGWEVTSLDLEGEPTIKCDILDWDHTKFPPGHFQVVWASPVCCEFSKALTRRPRRLEEGDRLVLIDYAPVLGPREPAERAAQDAALHGRPPLPGRDLLLLRQPLPEAHQGLGHAALRPAAPVLQGLPLRELPRRAPPHQGAARQPLPAAALRDPPRAVRGDGAVGKRCASTNASKPS